MDITESKHYRELIVAIINDGRAKQYLDDWMGALRDGATDHIKEKRRLRLRHHLKFMSDRGHLTGLFDCLNVDIKAGRISAKE